MGHITRQSSEQGVNIHHINRTSCGKLIAPAVVVVEVVLLIFGRCHSCGDCSGCGRVISRLNAIKQDFSKVFGLIVHIDKNYINILL